MKFYQKQGFALVVLILAILGASAWGISQKDARMAKQPVTLPEVKYQQWIYDDANLLSKSTENTVADYNRSWDSQYYAVVAVATVPSIRGWDMDDYAVALGEKWGLGTNDMLLVLVKGDQWYVACGDNVADTMTDTQQTQLRQSIDGPFYSGRYDDAVVAFYRQADVYYAQAAYGGYMTSSSESGGWDAYQAPSQARRGGVNIFGVIVLIGAVMLAWVILDRVRYSNYRRRYMGPSVVTPAVAYYPIFWGRNHYPSAPRPPRPPSAPSTTYRPSQPTGQRPAARPSAPKATSRPTRTGSSPRGGSGFGGKGFGGGSRGGRGGFGGKRG